MECGVLKDFLNNIAAEIVGSGLVLVLLTWAYARLGRAYRRTRSEARDLWWLPGWNSWRLVIRNMEGQGSLYDLRYRAWFRSVEPPRPGCSTSSFVDLPLVAEERIVLPPGQDLPILCFRFEKQKTGLAFIHTDKLGASLSTIKIDGRPAELIAEYTFRIRGPMQVPFTITRTLFIPSTIDHQTRGSVNIFELLLKGQSKGEHHTALPLTSEEEIGVPFPS